jgi:hypothetical protein
MNPRGKNVHPPLGTIFGDYPKWPLHLGFLPAATKKCTEAHGTRCRSTCCRTHMDPGFEEPSVRLQCPLLPVYFFIHVLMWLHPWTFICCCYLRGAVCVLLSGRRTCRTQQTTESDHCTAAGRRLGLLRANRPHTDHYTLTPTRAPYGSPSGPTIPTGALPAALPHHHHKNTHTPWPCVTFPVSVVVSTLQTQQPWERLCVERASAGMGVTPRGRSSTGE